MGAATLALAAGGLSAVSSIVSTSQANRDARYQAAAAEANAQAARNQAKITAEKGRIEAENIDRERIALTRAYADMQAGNAAGFGALGVDMSSGSAGGRVRGQRLALCLGCGAEPDIRRKRRNGDAAECERRPDQCGQL